MKIHSSKEVIDLIEIKDVAPENVSAPLTNWTNL